MNLCFLNLDDMMDEEVQLPLYLFKIYMCEDLSSQI